MEKGTLRSALVGAVCGFVAILCIVATSFACSQTLSSSRGAIPASFFTQHAHNRGQADPFNPATLPLTFGMYRTWDGVGAWSLVETSRGVYDWAALDTFVNSAIANGRQVLFTFGRTPTWASARPTEPSSYGLGNAAEPSDMTYLDEFATAVATRYLGKIHYYEVWNEPNFSTVAGNGQFFSGTATDLATIHQHIYTAVRAVDPTATIISAPPSSNGNGNPVSARWTAQTSYLTQVALYTDIVGFHGYGYSSVAALEAFAADMAKFKSLILTPAGLQNAILWDTENSWSGTAQTSMGADDQVLYITKSYLYHWFNNIGITGWYATNSTSFGTLVTNGATAGPYTLNDAGVASGELARWMTGATISYCEAWPNGTWSCKLTRSNYEAWMVWNENGSTTFNVPSGHKFTQRRDLTGALTSGANGQITIGKRALLLETGSAF